MVAKKNSTSNDLLDEIHSYGVNKKDRVIYLGAEYEPEESGVDFRMASRFMRNLDILNTISSDPITVKLMSYGGCWNYGMAIFDAMKLSNSELTIQCFAHSRSMSSIIPQAATNRYIARHCDFMIHYGTYGDEGDARSVYNGIAHYQKSNKVMIDLYVDRCINGPFAVEKNMSESKLYKFFKDKMDTKVDWWMNSEEAVYYGFMDGIL